jgi:hypothetical protein
MAMNTAIGASWITVQGTVKEDLRHQFGGKSDFLVRTRVFGSFFAALLTCVLQDRVPLNAFAYGAVPTGQQGELGEKFKCTKHSKIDCGTCFDWVKHIISKMEGKAKGEVGNRELLMKFLKSMGVEIPSSYNIKEGELETKLKYAFERAQSLKEIDPLPVHPGTYPIWKVCYPM